MVESIQEPVKAVTLQDIADRCGVTRMTVWRALHNETKRVSQETRTRILAIAKEMQYDPSVHQAASRLVNQRTGKAVLNQVVAFMFPEEYHSTYFKRLLEGMMETLIPVDYGLLLYHLWSEESPIPLTFRRGDVDALVAYQPVGHLKTIYDKLRSTANFGARPVVLLLSTAPGCASVLSDDFAGGYAAAAHLLNLGHRHILYDNVDHPTHDLRHRGYRQAYHDRGLDPDRYLVKANWMAGVPNQDYVQLKLDELQAHPEVTGVLAAFDEQAILLYRALLQDGKRVPEEYSIVGYDDAESLLDPQGQSVLTSVRVPLEEIGRTAAKLVLRLLAGTAGEEEIVTLPTEIVVRQSTAPPRKG